MTNNPHNDSFQPLQQALGPTSCKPFMHPLNHDVRFFLGHLQYHL